MTITSVSARTEADEAAARSRRRRRKAVSLIAAVRILLYVLIVIVFVAPIWSIAITAFSAEGHQPGQLQFIPSSFTLDNLVVAFEKYSVGRYLVNSLIVVVIGLVLQLIVSALAAYALSRRRFRGAAIILFIILSTMMLPEEIIALPLYLVLSDVPLLGMNLIDTYAGMILPVVGWGFSIFILTQFMNQIPVELEESARIDGAGDLRIFWNIIVPLIRPALATVTVFGFLMIWDQYLLPLIVAQSTEMSTLPLALRSLRQNDLVQPPVLMGAALVALVPTVLVYLGLQKHYESGLVNGAVKG